MASTTQFAPSGIVDQDAATRKAREVAAMLSKTLRSSIPLKPLSSKNTMMVPNDKVGLIIGKGGAQIKEIESVTGVKLQLDTSGLGEPSRKIWITGTDKGVALAKTKIQELLESSKFGGRAPTKIIPIPCDKVGLIIGTGGSTIRRLSQETSCHLKVVSSEDALRTGQKVPDEGYQNLHIIGSVDAAARAETAVIELLKSATNNRTASTTMTGYGAYQQQIYQQRAQPYAIYSPQNYGAIVQAYVNSSQSYLTNYAYAQQGQIYSPQVYGTQASVGLRQYPPPSQYPPQYTPSISTANAGLVDYSTTQPVPSNTATQQSASLDGNMSPMPGQQQIIQQAVPEYIHSVDNQRILNGSEKTAPQKPRTQQFEHDPAQSAAVSAQADIQ